MNKQKGFISMSVIYSFFLIFITVSAIIIANYTHNRLLIRETNKDIKNELSNAGNAKLATFTNLLSNGNMETSLAWTFSDSSAKFNSKLYTSSSRSIELANPASNREVRVSQSLITRVVPGHTYYVRYMIYAPAITSGSSSSVTLRNSSRTYTFSGLSLLGNHRTWQVQGTTLNIPSSAPSTGTWQLVFQETSKTGGPTYIDDVVLIDLTAAVGNDLPTTTWLNNNITYFNGTTMFNRTYSYDHLTS